MITILAQTAELASDTTDFSVGWVEVLGVTGMGGLGVIIRMLLRLGKLYASYEGRLQRLETQREEAAGAHKELHDDIISVQKELTVINDHISEVGERVARIEGALQPQPQMFQPVPQNPQNVAPGWR